MAKPNRVFEAGHCKVAVFKNKTVINDQEVTTTSIKIQKWYYDKKEDKVRNTDVLYPQDLADLIPVLQEAYRYTRLKITKNDDQS